MHVSIVNWVEGTDDPRLRPFSTASTSRRSRSALRAGTDEAAPHHALRENAGVAFQGPIPAGMGFIIDADEAAELLDEQSRDYADVVRRYLIGDDLVHDPAQAPTRWIIDFGRYAARRRQHVIRKLSQWSRASQARARAEIETADPRELVAVRQASAGNEGGTREPRCGTSRVTALASGCTSPGSI